MIKMIRRFFGKAAGGNDSATKGADGHDILVATCALFVEMAQIDEEFDREELDTILSILQTRYGLIKEHADALIAEARQALEDSIDYWQFARKINENYTTFEKQQIIENLWRIVFVDQKMDKHENYLMHKLAILLRLSHDQLIEAKLKVLNPA